jgi:hypothetical protein
MNKTVLFLLTVCASYGLAAQRVIRLDAAPKVLDVSQDGRRAVVSQPDARRIAIVDIERGVVVAYVPVNGVPDGVGFVR